MLLDHRDNLDKLFPGGARYTIGKRLLYTVLSGDQQIHPPVHVNFADLALRSASIGMHLPTTLPKPPHTGFTLWGHGVAWVHIRAAPPASHTCTSSTARCRALSHGGHGAMVSPEARAKGEAEPAYTCLGRESK